MNAPVVVGFLLMLALAAMLVRREPSPGRLARAHAGLEGGHDSCAVCHAAGGLDAGCLACHDEIAAQVALGRGFHAAKGNDCAQCHPEHHGASFDLLEALAWGDGGRAAFAHGHTEFVLSGRHDELGCAACHREEGTFLGLSQDCASCHEDVHGGALFRDCARCHDQQRFSPAPGFDHDRVFPLAGPHAAASCGSCHQGLEFRDVAGRDCASCHDSPHRFAAPDGCARCHDAADAAWTLARPGFDAARHAAAGFALSPVHAALECARCHDPSATYEARFPQPPRVANDCAACHGDPHEGQFRGRTSGACTDCHAADRFVPSLFGRPEHTAFPLRGAHARVECRECHEVVGGTRRFVDTPRACAGCHEDPHGGQFDASCATCHDERAFLPARYPLARHDAFPLDGAHGAVACHSCHTVAGGVRRFRGTPKECASCHADPHGGQFAREMKRDGCAACHTTSGFGLRPFDHARRTGFALEGAHAKASCARCHGVSGDPPVRIYRETARNCASCHRDEHRGQFAGRDCTTCHGGFERWSIPRFDHDRTRFPLDRRHAAVACSDCHPGVRQRDGATVTQYRPLGRKCGDCHEVDRR